MIVILFRSKLTSAAGEDFAEASDALLAYVRSTYGDDLVAMKSYTAEDGERLTVVWWRDPETLERWRSNPKHLEVKRLGRERWYDFYSMEVAEVRRESHFERPGGR